MRQNASSTPLQKAIFPRDSYAAFATLLVKVADTGFAFAGELPMKVFTAAFAFLRRSSITFASGVKISDRTFT